MMSEWKTYKLSELVEIKYGKDHKHLADGVIPVYGSGGIMRFAETHLYDRESILIPRKGTLSNLFYLDKPFWSVDTMFYTKIKNGVHGKYLYYLLKSMDLASMNVGSAVPSLTTEVLNKVEISLPDLPTQKEIASILSSLDDKIELNLQMNQTLEAMAQAIFKEWFVDFNFPGFDGELVDGLPKGWRKGKLGDIIDVKGGTTPSTSVDEYWNGDNYWTTPKDLSNAQSPVLIDTERKITDLGVKQISSGVLPKGTLLLSSRAPIGYLAISQVPISINQGYIAIQGKAVSNLFMLFWLKENMEAVKSKANGSTFQEISKSNFKLIDISIPSVEVLQRFDEVIDPVFRKIVENVYSNLSLTQTRDTLLPKLMSGQLEVV
jgi:type I restriction enzyme S subunit